MLCRSENAERFGLSQLHQLRGRVGRGADQSFCILMTARNVTDVARKRLDAMTQTADGFKIAEIDLQLRGPGDFLGTRQSGLPEFKLANLATDGGLVALARDAAFALAAADPELSRPEHQALRQAYAHYIRHHQLEGLTA